MTKCLSFRLFSYARETSFVACYFIWGLIRLTREYAPATRYQYSTKLKEKTFRGFLMLGLFLYIPIFLVSFILTSLFQVFFSIFIKWNRSQIWSIFPDINPNNEVFAIESQAESILLTSEDETLQAITSFTKSDTTKINILTFNIAWVPEFISVFNKLRPLKHRMKETIKNLLDHSSMKNTDILCLQEVWDLEDGIPYLSKHLKKSFPYFCTGFPIPYPWGLSSGIVIASKYPLSNIQFWTHPIYTGDDKFARKGVLGVIVTLPNNQKIIIFNTHLNAGGYNSDEVRKQQFERMNSNINIYMKNISEKDMKRVTGVFSAGDFNVGKISEDGGEHNKEWKTDVIQNFFEKENINISDGIEGTCFDMSDPSVGWDMNKVNRWATKKNRIDHIVISRKYGQPECWTCEANVDRMGGCSDHLAVLASLNYINK